MDRIKIWINGKMWGVKKQLVSWGRFAVPGIPIIIGTYRERLRGLDTGQMCCTHLSRLVRRKRGKISTRHDYALHFKFKERPHFLNIFPLHFVFGIFTMQSTLNI